MTAPERLDRIEAILALALHSYDGPDQGMEPTEFARYRLLLHELRTDVSRRRQHLEAPPPPH